MKLNNVIAKRLNKTIYEEAGLVYKVFDTDYSKAEVLNESLNHARVEETGLNLPKLEKVTKIDGKWTIVSEFIKGKRLDVLMNEDPQNIQKYIDMFVDLQIEVQEQRCPLLARLKDKLHRKISDSSFNATTRYDLHTSIEGKPTHNKLLHGDFHPKNIIITDDNKAYILDWAHATQGNASADVARSFLLFSLEGKEELAKCYLETFCKKSDTARQYVQKWIPIVAAAQSVNGNKEEVEMLNRWVNVVDYQ